MFEFIKEKSSNVGALCNFLKNETNIEYLKFVNNNTPVELPTLPEKICYMVNNMTELPLCTCGSLRKFIGFKLGWRVTCGKKECFVESRKITNIEKWGVDNPLKNAEIREKVKSTLIEKWGVDHPMKSEVVKQNFKSTMLGKWGVEWAQQNKEISEKSAVTFNSNPNKSEIVKKRSQSNKNKSDDEKVKIEIKKKQTKIEKWGSLEHYYQHFSDKIKETSQKKWGVNHHMSSPNVIQKRVQSYISGVTDKIINKLPSNIKYISRELNDNGTDSKINLICGDCQNEFTINRQYLNFRIDSVQNPCLNCNPNLHGKSQMESEVYDFVKSIYPGVIEKNIRGVISNEIDIYLPDKKIAIEFNGLFWHSEIYKEKMYHFNKTKECLEKDISLIHIWEDDWILKSEIIKSILSNKISESKKIGARHCEIKEITSNSLVKEFLDKNHIQAFVGSSVKIGLFFRGELVSIMTFGKLRRSLGSKSTGETWELIRFCTKLNYVVVGGASKLFQYFIKKWRPKEVISYSDTSRGVGNLYQKLNFKFCHDTEPNYYWIVDNIRRHRFNFRKDKLVKLGHNIDSTEVEIMHRLGHTRIFDCGSKKWSWVANLKD
jgi:hypothetical protein